jgi:hypothetical protein
MHKLALLIVLCSTVAYADDPTAPRSLVVHVPPTAMEVGAPIELEALIDAPYAESLSVRWRAIGEPAWHEARFERSSAGGWYATLPPATSPGVEYYIRGTDASGTEVSHFASESAPHVVHVDPSLYDRLEVLDRERLEGRTEEVSFDVEAHRFGNQHGFKDQYLRGELVYTHRFLRILHEVGFGFGSLQGNAPAVTGSMSDVPDYGLRYGFGQVRLRVHPSVFVDGRIGMGVSEHGFEENIRGAVTFGKPWRSSVQIGAEYLGELGPSTWARLQWDTVPPLIMGATAIYSDLPNANDALSSTILAYDVGYRFGAMTVRASISYGSRDGPARVGGGLGTSVGF